MLEESFMVDEVNLDTHPLDSLLRKDRFPHIWCGGCGIGTALNIFLWAILKTAIPLDKFVIVSGIGCAGRVAGYVKLDSFHTTHGRAIPWAIGLKLARPEMKVIVFSGEGDLIAIGGNHFIHAARRNVDITVICINNSNYGMTGGQYGPTTPTGRITTTSPYGNLEYPFSLPYLAAGSGAVYVARWTVLNVRQLQASLVRAIQKEGFSFVEIISPCPTLYGRMNNLGSGLEMMKFYKENTVINHKANLKNIHIGAGEKIVVGNFVDIERPSYIELMKNRITTLKKPSLIEDERKKIEHE